jgi:hypothetical protein
MSLTNLSLNNTSHPARSTIDELVPSRYALKVGEIDVLVVSDGMLPLPTAMLGHNADPSIRRPGWAICSCRRTLSTGH